MSDSDDTIPYNIEEAGEPSEREQSPSPIPPPCSTPLEAGKMGGGGTERLGGPQRGGGSPRCGGGPPRHGGRGHQMT